MAERTKIINCTNPGCRRTIEVYGQGDGKLVSQGVTCPYCKHPNETDWPMNASIAGRKTSKDS